MRNIYLAWSCIYGKKRWFISFVLIFFMISVLSFSGICGRNRLEQYFTSMQKMMDMDVRVELSGGQVDMVPGMPCLSDGIAKELEKLPQVTGVNYTCSVQGIAEGFEGMNRDWGLTPEDMQSDVIVVGMTDIAEYGLLQEESIEMVSGRLPTADGEAAISHRLAEANAIELNESIQIRGFGRTEAVTLRVVGLHSGENRFTSPVWADPSNLILSSLDDAVKIQGFPTYREGVYTLKSAAETEGFLEASQELIGETENLDLVPMRLNYNILNHTAGNMNGFVVLIVLTIFIFGGMVAGINIVDYIHKNRRAIGVFLALGKSRNSIVINYVLQLLFPMGIGILGSLLILYAGTGILDLLMPEHNLFGQYTAHIGISVGQFLFVLMINVIVLAVFCCVGFIKIYRVDSGRLLKQDMDN